MIQNSFFRDKSIVGSPIKHYIRFCIYMYLFWLLITQSLSLKYLIMGAVSAVVVSWICTPLFLINSSDQSKKYFAMDVSLIHFAVYIVWLMKELILANIDVAKTIWKKSLPIEPKVLRFKVNYDNPVALALLANSITLTPGTITMSVNEDHVYEIHALTPGAADGIISGSMAVRVAKLFHEDPQVIMLPEEGGTV